MFGYVRLHKPTIRMGEYEQYRGIYCTLCKRLGKRYGLFARMGLSYDLTFLALLQTALEEQGPDFCPGRCSFNPTKRCLRCQRTGPTDRAADLTVLLTYYKLRDTLADEGFFKRLGAVLLYPMAAFDRRRAAKRQPQADQHIAAMMQAQQAVEQARTPSLDRAAEPFALLLQWMAGDMAGDDRQRLVLERLGYCLGRWVYLMDAVDDRQEDARRGRYNPFLLRKDEDENAALYNLNSSLAECIAAYNLLEVRRFDGILRNIMEEGMPAAQRQVIAGKDATS
ncbi:MAG: hypothetical protein E7541_07320 [Ruminococcaceae bacterium]|nr:hypothetical protein [Oscillospiraceae bacterium]